MRKWLAGCLAVIVLVSGIAVFAENTGTDTVSIQESMVSVEGETVGTLSDNLRFVADLIKNEEIRSLLKTEDVGEIFTEVILKVLAWLYENRPVTTKILIELGIKERDRRCVDTIWDSVEKIAKEVDAFKASEEGQQLKKDFDELTADADFQNSVLSFLNFVTSENVSAFISNFLDTMGSYEEQQEDNNGPLTKEALKRELSRNSFTGSVMLDLLSTFEKSDWGDAPLPDLIINEKFWRFVIDLASLDTNLDNVIQDEIMKLVNDPEINDFIIENIDGLTELQKTIIETTDTEESAGETGGDTVPDSAVGEEAP